MWSRCQALPTSGRRPAAPVRCRECFNGCAMRHHPILQSSEDYSFPSLVPRSDSCVPWLPRTVGALRGEALPRNSWQWRVEPRRGAFSASVFCMPAGGWCYEALDFLSVRFSTMDTVDYTRPVLVLSDDLVYTYDLWVYMVLTGAEEGRSRAPASSCSVAYRTFVEVTSWNLRCRPGAYMKSIPGGSALVSEIWSDSTVGVESMRVGYRRPSRWMVVRLLGPSRIKKLSGVSLREREISSSAEVILGANHTYPWKKSLGRQTGPEHNCGSFQQILPHSP